MRIPIQSVTPECGRAEVCGWVHEVRDLGGLAFMLVRDRTGIIQVTIPKKKVSEAVLAAVKAVSRESVVRVCGPVKAIDKAPGGRELVPESIEIISLAETPLPLDVSEKVPVELDTRLDARFLDVRRPRVAAVFEIRSAATYAINQFLHNEGFTNKRKKRRIDIGRQHKPEIRKRYDCAEDAGTENSGERQILILEHYPYKPYEDWDLYHQGRHERK